MAKVKGVDQLFPKVLLVQHSVILTLPADTSSSYVLYMLMLWVFSMCSALHSLQKSFSCDILWPSCPAKELDTLPLQGGLVQSLSSPCPTISLLMTSKFLSAALTFLLKPDAENQLPAVLLQVSILKASQT